MQLTKIPEHLKGKVTFDKIAGVLRAPCEIIVIDRENRQRKIIETSDLEPSIQKRGVLQPIIIGDDFVLVAGERRLTASIKLGLPDIPIRFTSTLDPQELQIIELEENLRRSDLCWQDQILALDRIHKLYLGLDSDWTKTATANALCISLPDLSHKLRVAGEMHLEKISKAESFRVAYNMLARRDDRAIGDAMSDLVEAGIGILDAPVATQEPPRGASGVAPRPVGTPPIGTSLAPLTAPHVPSPPRKILPAEESIVQADFIKWVETYSGPKFNFVHCDFPYGIDVFAGKMSGRESWTGYADAPDVYWNLISALCKNLNKIMAHSGHLMFWFSMDYYCETLEAFRKLAPDLHFQKMPLIWHKTDNVGILSDPRRRPRHVYETAMIASREDRQIIKSVSDTYGAPTNKDHHPSTKPEPMLRQFFQMFVDEYSTMLDPTCGSGSSIRAAESLGAKRVLGLERDPEHCKNAQMALKQFRVKRAMEGKP